jgi:hypothetical protein
MLKESLSINTIFFNSARPNDFAGQFPLAMMRIGNCYDADPDPDRTTEHTEHDGQTFNSYSIKKSV